MDKNEFRKALENYEKCRELAKDYVKHNEKIFKWNDVDEIIYSSAHIRPYRESPDVFEITCNCYYGNSGTYTHSANVTFSQLMDKTNIFNRKREIMDEIKKLRDEYDRL